MSRQMIVRLGAAGIFVAATALLAIGSARAQVADRNCLHGAAETPANASRRTEAIAYARTINEYEMRAKSQAGRFQPLSEFHNFLNAPPQGFVIRLTTDGDSYAFKLQDEQDGCAFSIFSDDAGVIFTGVPIR